MTRKEKTCAIILMATIMIFSIIGSTLYISCKPIPTTPTFTPLDGKLIPAYTLRINYPSNEGFVTVEKGGSVTLPVAIWSLVDESIKIRLTLIAPGKVPAFVEYEVPEGYITLNPRDTIDTQITIKVSEDAQPASYSIGITGKLEEPVKERGGEGIMFSLTVIDRQS